jgi:hypothetical protein
LEPSLVEYLQNLNRKFYAKLKRVAEECNVDPSIVLNEGIDLYRKRHRLMNGPLAKRLNNPEQLEQYSRIQQIMGKMGTNEMSPQALSKRGLAGAKARAEKIKRKKGLL